MPDTSPPAPPIDAARFIAKWSGVTASELSTAQSFALDLCRLLGVDAPHPDAEQRYMFERPVTFVHGDGSESAGRIDLYKRGCFVLEAKSSGKTPTRAASTMPCCAHAVRPNNTPAPCPQPRAARHS